MEVPEGPESGKLVPGTAFDGQVILGLDYPVFGEEGGLGGRGGLVGRWNPAFHGWSARLAAAALIRGAPILGGRIAAASARPARFIYELDEAWLRYPVRAAGWSADFQAGRFRWRSHPDAALAGEYLTRWGAYPIRLLRAGMAYEPLDSLTVPLSGLRAALSTPGRMFRQEVLAVVDSRQRAWFLTLIGSATFAPLPGLEAGFAAARQESLGSGHPSSTASYGTYHPDPAATDTFVTVSQGEAGRLEFRVRSYSARISMDIATWIMGASRKDRGGRMYAEAAVLGWNDYPPYYEGRNRRIQFCGGLNLPAFGILDVLRLQAERRSYPRWDNPYRRSLEAVYAGSAVSAPSRWWIGQVHLSRSLLPWLEIQALAARDWGPEAPGTIDFVALDPETGREPPPTTRERGWSCEARITARL